MTTEASAPSGEAPFVIPKWLWISMIAMLLGNFMALLDIQIVASSIGQIQAGISANRDEVARVQTIYLIAEVIGIPLSGFLTTALGYRRVFALAALAFGAASFLCGISWDLDSLVAFRALQGFTGGLIIPSVMSLLYAHIPRDKMMGFAAMIGVMASLAPTIGPTLGGSLAEHFGWRMMFYINIVPSILISLAVWRYLRFKDGTPGMLRKIDFLGLIAMALFLGSLEWILEEGPKKGWLTDAGIAVWAVTCLFAGGCFLWRTQSQKPPIVDLRPINYPVFAIGLALFFITGIGQFGPIFLQPVFLGQIRGLNPEQIGHMMFAQGLVMLVGMPIQGRFFRNQKDFRLQGCIGFVLVGISCWMQTNLTAQSDFNDFVYPQLVRGLGLVLSFTAVMQPCMQALPQHLMGSGAPLFNLIRNLGGAFGLALLTTLQTHLFAFHRQELYSAANAGDPHVARMIAGQEQYLAQTGGLDPHRQAVMHYVQLLDREALVMTFNDLFYFLTAMCFIGAASMLLLRSDDHPSGWSAETELRDAH